jgi:DMSO/TMAO reductase YedYZ molybdopterin-dependent catalytic subunit
VSGGRWAALEEILSRGTDRRAAVTRVRRRRGFRAGLDVPDVGDGWERTLAGALCGAAAGTVALSAAQVGGALVGGALPPVQVLGDFVIRVTPVSVTEALIRQVGRSDKTVLLVCLLLVAAVAAGLVGIVFVRGRVRTAMFGIAGLAVLPVGATRGETSVSTVREFLVLLPAAALGAAVLWVLGRPLLHAPNGAQEAVQDGSSGVLQGSRSRQARRVRQEAAEQAAALNQAKGVQRRQLLRATGVLAASAIAGTVAVRRLTEPSAALMRRLAATLPRPRAKLAPLTDEFASVGASTLVTPNASFYRIDTSLSPPRVNPDSWTLNVSRDGRRLRTYGYDELLSRATSEADITIGCVSNELGGDLIGTARWQGVLLADLLADAGITTAGRVSGVSVDGFVASFAAGAAFDGRPAMVAVGMNGHPLPVKHGFPARLVVPGLYGYTSATKWLQTIDVSDSTDLPGFWADRGWTPTVTVHITSRIDTPRNGRSVRPGTVQLAGIAWAPVAGIGTVDIQVDNGPWMPARLSAAVTGTLWRQWALNWMATPGTHVIRVRATDAQGRAQDTTRRPVYPSGATGLHEVIVTVV